MRGGARVRSGTPADPNAVQPEQFTELPTAREGEPPAWPLVPKAKARELVVWRALWAQPQAVQWELRGLELEVAVHVRTHCVVERGRATSSMLSEWRRQRDSLGLSIGGYRAAKFTPQVNADPRPKRSRATGTEGAPLRWQPEVIDGGS